MARLARPRQKQSGRSSVGERFETVVGPIAHGGHCVARVGDENRVVFVRHALPGERVVVEITEGGEKDRFWRGDAVEVLEASSDRVEAPCALAHPDGCGGCDFQHVALSAQRALKTAVLREQLLRLAKIESDVEVEAVETSPGEDDGLRWRTRQRYVETPVGKGMRKHRSHDVVLVDDCLIEGPDPVTTVTASGFTHDFEVNDDGFWQVHPGAPTVLVETVLDFLAPSAGESALDLYAGVGLFAAFLRDAVGESGTVVTVEGDADASKLTRRNVPQVQAHAGDVAEVLAEGVALTPDVVVLDPPREGAKRVVVEEIVGRAPRAVAYVACDPAALARDVAIFAEHGYRMTRLRSFDLFPMTHHLEAVALLERS